MVDTAAAIAAMQAEAVELSKAGDKAGAVKKMRQAKQLQAQRDGASNRSDKSSVDCD